ncbi:unnamed protein product, partial [Amoebophrya sp. A25]|eukprot:GSA25T00016856001.1
MDAEERKQLILTHGFYAYEIFPGDGTPIIPGLVDSNILSRGTDPQSCNNSGGTSSKRSNGKAGSRQEEKKKQAQRQHQLAGGEMSRMDQMHAPTVYPYSVGSNPLWNACLMENSRSSNDVGQKPLEDIAAHHKRIRALHSERQICVDIIRDHMAPNLSKDKVYHFATQQMLRVLRDVLPQVKIKAGISKNRAAKAMNKRVMDCFSGDQQKQLIPFLTSSYKLTHKGTDMEPNFLPSGSGQRERLLLEGAEQHENPTGTGSSPAQGSSADSQPHCPNTKSGVRLLHQNQRSSKRSPQDNVADRGDLLDL